MLKFEREHLFDLLRFVISSSTEEKVMLRAWRLFRSKTRAPLFRVDMSDRAWPRRQAYFNEIAVEAMLEEGLSIRDTCKMTGLHRSTVHRYRAKYAAMDVLTRNKRRKDRWNFQDWVRDELELRAQTEEEVKFYDTKQAEHQRMVMMIEAEWNEERQRWRDRVEALEARVKLLSKRNRPAKPVLLRRTG